MDWELSIRHLICGYIPVFLALVVYFVLTSKRRKLSKGHITASFVFCFYLVGILTMTGIWYLGSFAPRIVYIPFVDMIRGACRYCTKYLSFYSARHFSPINVQKV